MRVELEKHPELRLCLLEGKEGFHCWFNNTIIELILVLMCFVFHPERPKNGRSWLTSNNTDIAAQRTGFVSVEATLSCSSCVMPMHGMWSWFYVSSESRVGCIHGAILQSCNGTINDDVIKFYNLVILQVT